MQSSLRKRNRDIAGKSIIPLLEARERRVSFEWQKAEIPIPPFIGKAVTEDISLSDLEDFIDWTFFFTSWEIPRKYPAVLEDKKYGEAARNLLKDAKRILKEIIDGDLLQAKARYGFWKANSHGDDILLYDVAGGETMRLNMLRQQQDRGDSSYSCLSDFIASVDSERTILLVYLR